MKARSGACALSLLLAAVCGHAQEPLEREQVRNEFLELGTDQDYAKWERYRTIDQISSFIPPLFEPAFVGHGYVLPPGAIRVGVRAARFDVDGDDFFKDGDEDIVHENHEVDRHRLDLDLLYGLDHNMTVFLNVPYWVSSSTGSVHPAGVLTMDRFVEAQTEELGDVSLILKKKWFDQANHHINLATVTGIKFPTGSSSEKFDRPTVVKQEDGTLVVDPNPFARFTDDGELPAGLQPGTGAFGYIIGLMGTRQFSKFTSAFHAGVVARFLAKDDGVDPGDEIRFFGSYVKPVLRDSLSVDLTINGMHKERDKYDGLFTHPFPNPDGTLGGLVTTPRPSFRGGTVVFFSPSLIWSPQPQYRLTVTGSFRLNEPDLGPWPGTIVQVGVTYTF